MRRATKQQTVVVRFTEEQIRRILQQSANKSKFIRESTLTRLARIEGQLSLLRDESDALLHLEAEVRRRRLQVAKDLVDIDLQYAEAARRRSELSVIVAHLANGEKPLDNREL